jgi:hypothetical protein
MRRLKFLFISIFIFANAATHAQLYKKLKPDFISTQFAGSIGYFSIGSGYNMLKNNARLSIHYGFIPENKGGQLHVISTKFIITPKVYNLKDNLFINPFDIGLMITYHLGKNFKTVWPSEVQPKGYYWWPTALRAHVAWQPSVTFVLAEKYRVKSLSPYIEFNTNDLYVVSFIQNASTVPFYKLIKMGAGIRINLSE